MRQRYRRWALRLLRCYPSSWRERYAEEMAVTLDQHEITVMTLIDLMGGALDAHLRPTILPGQATMARRVQNSEIAIFCAFVLFGIAWLPLQGMRDPLPIWENAVRPHPEIRAAFDLVQIAGFVAVIAVVIGGVPFLGRIALRAIRIRRRDVLLPLTVPFVAAAILAGYGLIASSAWTQRQTPAPNGPLTLLAVTLQLGFVIIVGVAIVGSVVAIAIAVARSEPEERMARYALLPAALTTLAMVAGLIGTLVLCTLTRIEAPQLRSFGDVPVVLVMSVAATLALSALRRGLYARAG